jgi:hypothetical protein
LGLTYLGVEAVETGEGKEFAADPSGGSGCLGKTNAQLPMTVGFIGNPSIGEGD